jgi:hypothetical protein
MSAAYEVLEHAAIHPMEPDQNDRARLVVRLDVVPFGFFGDQRVALFEIGNIHHQRVRLRLLVDGHAREDPPVYSQHRRAVRSIFLGFRKLPAISRTVSNVTTSLAM